MHDKLIFLDIDDVMTSMHDNPGSFLLGEPDKYGISPSCIRNLLKLCDMTNAKVILSSNWRKFPDNGIWPYQGKGFVNPINSLKMKLGNLYAGELPAIRHITKVDALRLWFRENELTTSDINYVIFDDDIAEQFDASEFKDKFIMTDYHVGLTVDDCAKAVDCLVNPNMQSCNI